MLDVVRRGVGRTRSVARLTPGEPAIDRRQPGRELRHRRVAVARLRGQVQRAPAVARRCLPDRARELERGVLAHAAVRCVRRTHLPRAFEQPLRVHRTAFGQRHLAQAGHRFGEERVIAAEQALEDLHHRFEIGARLGGRDPAQQRPSADQPGGRRTRRSRRGRWHPPRRAHAPPWPPPAAARPVSARRAPGEPSTSPARVARRPCPAAGARQRQ